MESLNLLKFWRHAGGETTAGAEASSATDAVESCGGNNNSDNDVNIQALDSDDETDAEDSFFDLVFTAVGSKAKQEGDARNGCPTNDGAEKTMHFAESPRDVFSCGKSVPIDSNSKPQSPISFLRSPAKFRVFFLGFKKSKSEKTEINGAVTATPKHEHHKPPENQQGKQFTVKYKVEEVPLTSVLSRDNSLRRKLQLENAEDFTMLDSSKRFPKDAVPKYLKLIKPLYGKVSKRYCEKMKFSDSVSTVTPSSSPTMAHASSPRKLADDKHSINGAAGFRIVYKHLGKSRSSSSTAGMMPSPLSRRDDSLLEQHDGIQGAILYCKRSYNSSSKECSVLWRSASDPCHEKSVIPPRDSIHEQNRWSI